MSWWVIVLLCLAGYAVFSLLLVPVFVYSQIDRHKQFKCEDKHRICYANRHEKANYSEEDKTLLERRCSADYVSDHAVFLPFMLLLILPRIFAFTIVNRLENKDEKIRELEAEKKSAEEENRRLLKDFDIVMTRIEEDAKLKSIGK